MVRTRGAAEVAIIGGGVIGLAVAIRLRSEGRDVVVIEPNAPGSGASYGNAGTIADYAIMPVATPAVLRNLPSLLLDSDSPLAIRRAALPMLMPWLARFAFQALPGNARKNTARLASLLADAAAGWRELASETRTIAMLRSNGAVYLYRSVQAFRAASVSIELRKSYGIDQQLLSADEIAQLEPALPRFEGGGVFFPGVMHLTDPGMMMQRLAAAAGDAGVRFITATAERLDRTGEGVRVTGKACNLRAKTVVIAAGAHSRRLAAMAGDCVPLDTERGYHVEFDMDEPLLSRPVCPIDRGFYLVPMASRLRAAGTVELGGLAAPADPHRLALIERGARETFPGLGRPDRTWLGFRPSMPDSVPVIRPSRGGSDVLLAFGHGHLGLTLAPVTARLISGMLS